MTSDPQDRYPFRARTSEEILDMILTPGFVCDETIYVPPVINRAANPGNFKNLKKKKRKKRRAHRIHKPSGAPGHPPADGRAKPAGPEIATDVTARPDGTSGQAIGVWHVPRIKTKHKKQRPVSSIRSIDQILALSGDETQQKAEAARLGREWAERGSKSVRGATIYAITRFKKEMREGRIKGGLKGADYWRFIHRETVDWIAEAGYCNDRYLGRKDFAAKLHKAISRELH